GFGEWAPNYLGTNVNLEAQAFLKKLNTEIFAAFPYAMMIAEESTAFPMVTKPVDAGGLGFNFKWNMGWMNDVLSYVKTDPLWRGEKHNQLTFSMVYAFSENFILPISHDEVVHLKGSLVSKMPGDYDKKFAGVRVFMGYVFAHPGKKLMFMGQEFGQFREWAYAEGLEFFLTDYQKHACLKRFFADLNRFYRENDALYSIENSWDGFEWLIADDAYNNMLCFVRKGASGQKILAVINFSGLEHRGYGIGVDGKEYKLVFTSEERLYGGRANFRKKKFLSVKKSSHGKGRELKIDIAPLSFMYLEQVL
ncbi:MAG: alpha amylase C-terminal domain-containing protein, partial [Clostridia bacterium]|nr:alpha amylase C-terminal domain-containing protein [Clostridia bacterium]